MITVLRTTLLNDATVSGLVSDRVDPFQRVEPGSDELPAILYEYEQDEPIQGMGGVALRQATVNFVAFSEQLSESETVAAAVISVLDGFDSSDDDISKVVFIGMDRDTTEPFDGSENYFYSTSITFEVWYT